MIVHLLRKLEYVKTTHWAPVLAEELNKIYEELASQHLGSYPEEGIRALRGLPYMHAVINWETRGLIRLVISEVRSRLGRT